MIYEPFTVVLTPFPFTDKNTTKKRPALIISESCSQKYNNAVTCMMITSAKKGQKNWWGDHKINHLESTGLPIPSIIRQKIFTIDARLIIKQLGQLDNTDKSAVLNLLKKHLTLG